VTVAVDDHESRAHREELRLERGHHGGRLLGVAPRSHTEVHVRLGQVQLGEEDLGHVVVVVLPGVDEALLDGVVGESGDHRRRLREVRARPDHVGDESHGSLLATSAHVAGTQSD